MSIIDAATRHRIDVQHWTATGSDDRGNQAGNWTDDIDTDVPARMIQRGEAERQGNEATILGIWDLWLRPTTAIEETARVVFDGRAFQVVALIDHYGWDGRVAVRQAELREIA